MVFNAKRAKRTAFVHLIVGVMMLSFGIANQTLYDSRRFILREDKHDHEFTGQAAMAIWVAIWVIATGIVGIVSSRRTRSYNPTFMCNTVVMYMWFSIISALFATIAAVCYIVVLQQWYGDGCGRYEILSKQTGNYDYHHGCSTGIGLNSLMLICAILEFGVSSYSAVLCYSARARQSYELRKPEQPGHVSGVVPYVIPRGSAGRVSPITSGNANTALDSTGKDAVAPSEDAPQSPKLAADERNCSQSYDNRAYDNCVMTPMG